MPAHRHEPLYLKGDSNYSPDYYASLYWRDYVGQVRAVLTAIREPSEGMEDAGAFAGDWNRDNLAIGEEAKKVYSAMINAMLADG